MLTIFQDLRGRKVCAQDGICGRVDDVYFDDRSGRVRYFVLKVGRWPRWQRVLVEPHRIEANSEGLLSVNMTCEDVKRLPHPDTDPPVSRQLYLLAQHQSPDTPVCTAALGGGMMTMRGSESLEGEAARAVQHESSEAYDDFNPKLPPQSTPFDVLLRNRKLEQNKAHLRSVCEVSGYDIELECGRAGRLVDVWLDTTNWQVTHLSLQLRVAKHRVAVPATLVRGISWGSGTVRLSADWGQSSEGPCLVPSNPNPQPSLPGWNQVLQSRTLRGAKAS